MIGRGSFKKAATFILFVSTAALLCGATLRECSPVHIEPAYHNPYQNHPYWYKGNTHTHTRLSDGELSTQAVADLYRQAGYDFLALTDHNRVNTQNAEGLLVLRGCESGDWWENHLTAIGVSRCPEECASCAWGVGLPNCSTPENQKRINQALEQNGLVILNHPAALGKDCWPGEPIEQGWPFSKLLGVTGFHGIEIANALDHWRCLLSHGRRVWGVASDDFHSGAPGRTGWIVVNSARSPAEAEDITAGIRDGNFYAVLNGGRDAARTPAFLKVQVLGNVVAVTFRNAGTVRFIDCLAVLEEKFLSGDETLERSASFTPGSSGSPPMPRGYVRIELEDRMGNVAFSQPLQVIGAAACPQAAGCPPAATCSRVSCAELPCCTGYHCCEDRCYPNSMACP